MAIGINPNRELLTTLLMLRTRSDLIDNDLIDKGQCNVEDLNELKKNCNTFLALPVIQALTGE